jgi:hypothetical protein
VSDERSFQINEAPNVAKIDNLLQGQIADFAGSTITNIKDKIGYGSAVMPLCHRISLFIVRS